MSNFYVPRTKEGLLKMLLPTWKGSKTELRQMGIKRIRAIFMKTRERQLMDLMKRDKENNNG